MDNIPNQNNTTEIPRMRFGLTLNQYSSLSPELQRALGGQCLSNYEKMKYEVEDLVEKVKRFDSDTGSPEVQSMKIFIIQ